MSINLPHDIVVDILSRIPVKPLLRFRCVCKSWRALVSDPGFIGTHFNRSTSNNENHPSNLLFTNVPNKNHPSVLLAPKIYRIDSGASDEAYQLDLPFPRRYNSISVAGSCNGLVCLTCSLGGIFYVLNPSTRVYKKLPEITFLVPPRCFWLGFGYSPITDEYKVVKIMSVGEPGKPFMPMVLVHTLGTDSWREIADVSFKYDRATKSEALVNGCIHLIATPISTPEISFIASFDVGKEEFRELPLPDFGQVDQKMGMGLVVLSGCLSILCWFRDHLDIWVMEDYGVKQSWNKKFWFAGKTMIGDFEFLKPLSFHKEAEVKVETLNGDLFLYDPVRKRARDLSIHDISWSLIHTYVGSLTSPSLLKADSGMKEQHQIEGKIKEMENAEHSADVEAGETLSKQEKRKMEEI